MEEEEVDPIPLVADAEPLLTPDEGEVAAQFEEEDSSFLMRASSRSCSEYSSLRSEKLQH